jgi:hypothetical protein
VRATGTAVILIAAASLAGCAGTNTAALLTSSADKTAQPPSSIAVSSTLMPLGSTPSVKGAPIAVYERVARGVLNCWFGSVGPLKKTHMFNADVTPPSKGGEAEMSIHEREANPQPNQHPRGARVFRVELKRESDESTRVHLEAGRLPVDLINAMEKDAIAWAADKESCEALVVRPPPPPAPEPVKTKVKPRAKTAQR